MTKKTKLYKAKEYSQRRFKRARSYGYVPSMDNNNIAAHMAGNDVKKRYEVDNRKALASLIRHHPDRDGAQR